MPGNLDTEPLIEFGSPIAAQFCGRWVPAQRDLNSGYVFFAAPDRDELSRYYQGEYAESQSNYYTIESDYEPGKNSYHAGRILAAYDAAMHRAPRTSFELGCAYGGMVAHMAGLGIDAHGSDINQDGVRQGRDRKGNCRILGAANLDALATLDRPVDLIYSVHTLEHDPDMFEVVAACRDRLTEDGLLFVAVPNAMFAGSVINGFMDNMWVNYPQHLHMLSAGFIPRLCEQTGFSPVFWDTRIMFQVQPNIENLFGAASTDQAGRDLWTRMLCQAGHGMELNIALTPIAGAAARRLAETIKAVGGSLESARRHEVGIRTYLRDAVKKAS